jgi:hypothetical protein
VPGISSITLDVPSNSLVVQFGSGAYDFALTGAEATHICASAPEQATLSLTCPAGSTISAVAFASYGTAPLPTTSSLSPSSAVCSAEHVYTITSCHAGTSKAVIEQACVGRTQCVVPNIGNALFAIDPCPHVPKHVLVDVVCASN